MRFELLRAVVAGAALCLLCTAVPAFAADPDTRSIIEALKPGATRSLRNLQVQPRAGEGAASSAGLSAAVAPLGEPDQADASAASTGAAPNLTLAIQFEANSARVRPVSGPLLGNLVAALQSPELKGYRFVIEGHTDARGAMAANQRLSQERADEVRLYLVALGVHPARLRAVGRGASEPANANDPLAAENRRVRVVTMQ